MKNGFLKGLVGAVCAACLFLAAGVAPAGQSIYKTIPGSVPPVLAKLALIPLSSAPATNILNLAIALPVRNQAGLDLLQQQIYDPASPNYHRYLTPAEFAAQFGATEQDCQAVVAFAQSHGLTVRQIHPNRLIIDVTGPVANIEAAFQVRLNVYQHPTEARTFFAPATEPVVDASLPILRIDGLDNYYLPQSRMMIKPQGLSPQAGTAPGGGYSAADLRKAYIPDTKLTGTGQNVGLLQFDGFFPNDITAYAASNRISNPPQVVVVPVDGGVSSPGGGNEEVAMDIQMVMALAPGVSTIFVYEAPNPSPWVDLLSRMANDNLAKQLSCSWGGGPANAAAEQIFQQMAVQGQSFYNAVGDTAAFIPVINPPVFPSESPNITQVGGTVLATSSRGVYLSETVWNTPTIPRENTFQGGSGGISLNYSIPPWQLPISMTSNHGSKTKRNMPDVALIADNIWIVFDDGVSGPYGGGTSSAAPLWAAYTALINQQAAGNGKSPMGFINPALYAIATNATSYAACFHDITTGANTNSLSPANFLAVAGYDLCTGLGTPNGASLIYALAGKSPRTGFLQLTVNPSSGSTLLNSSTQSVFVTINDGGFDVTNATVTAVIPGVGNLTFLNNGQAPDTQANDAVYSASFSVPSSVTALTMTLVANATNEIGATNTIYFSVVPVPSNDNFTNATKVPLLGATYQSNNRFATLEPNEPAHDGDSGAAASLWWQWTPATATNVLIDTIGSKIDNVLAVYTGSVLAANLPVVAAAGSSLAAFKPAYVSFNAQAGVTYRIAVASFTSNNLGSLVLHVTPGGQLDTVPPSLVVVSPLNGQTVTNQGILISGVAFDPTPNASGVSQLTVSVNGISTTATGTTNWTAPVALQPALNVVTVTAVDAAGNVSPPTTLDLSLLLPPVANDFFVNAIALGGTSGVVSNNTVNATREAGEPNITGNPGGHSIWWTFRPAADGVLTLNTTNSTFDTLLGLYTGPDVSDLTLIAENDDAYPGAPGGFSFISQAVRANVTYSITVDGYDGASGNARLAYAFTPATVYHLVVTNSPGGSVQLTTVNSVGGISQAAGQTGDFAAGTAVTLIAIPGPTGQFINWTGTVASAANPLNLVLQTNVLLMANFAPFQFTDGFESGGLTHLGWVTTGDLPWFVQTNVVAQGIYAARSGAISDSQTSSLILTTNFAAGIASFDFKVSSETNWDILNFSVDSVLYKQWSGEIGWANYAFAVSPGRHTLQWTYVKDPSDYAGLDAAFIDDVNLPLSLPAPPAPPQLQLQRQSDGSLVVTLTGQAGAQYVIQSSTNLVNWINYSTNVATGGIIQIPLPVNPGSPSQFYRALAP